MQDVAALIFDLDGVILRSTSLKYKAMLSLFEASAQQRVSLSSKILALGGVPRAPKLTHVLRMYLERDPTEVEVQEYLHRYEHILAAQLMLAEPIPGLREYLMQTTVACSVLSSAPLNEVEHQLERNGLRAFFSAVHGGNEIKAKVLSQYAEYANHRSIVFFGDAVADHNAALEAGAAFVAVTGDVDNFCGIHVPRITDFTDKDALQDAIDLAITQCAT